MDLIPKVQYTTETPTKTTDSVRYFVARDFGLNKELLTLDLSGDPKWTKRDLHQNL